VPRAWVAEPEEAEAVARLIAGFRDFRGHDEPGDDVLLKGVQRLIEQPGTDFLLAAADDDSPPMGYIQLRFRWSVWMAAPDAWLEDLYVDARARRRGLAEALMVLAFDRASARGAKRMELDTWESNAPALALYARHGFSDHSKHNDSRDLLLGAVVVPEEEED
jgi:ribosomal protein S18 acetylase RimI-like enzyme